MKKILASLLVLALCAPAMAATVSFTDNTDGTGTFTITTVGVGDEYMVGVALDVLADAGITAVTVPAAFNVYPDAGYTIGATFDPWGAPAVAGTPVCAVATPGEIALPGTAGTFAICFANLNGPSTPGATGAQTIDITFAAPDGTQVTISENAARAGVVGTLGEDIALTGTLTGTITVAVTECVKSTASFYTDWVNYGKPDCWCYQRQCRGDANGTQSGPYWVSGADLTIFKNAFNKTDGSLPAGGICADFNHAASGPYRVSGADLTIFKTYFNKAEASVPVCDAADYNSWTN